MNMKTVAPLLALLLSWSSAFAQDTKTEPAKADAKAAPVKAESTPQAEASKVKLEDLAWMSGCWKSKSPQGTNIQEWWSKPVGNLMMGMGFVVKNGKYISYEHMRIEVSDAGELVFSAKPYKQGEASFTLTSKTATNLVFENPKHDFPQRVIYRQEKDGGMEARIDGLRKGQKQAALFPFVRMTCE